MKVKVKIIGKAHLHRGETGTIYINRAGVPIVESIGHELMVLIELIDCPHGVGGCYATPEEIKILEEA